MQLPPLLERAHQRKQDALDANNLQWELEKRTKEIHELKVQLRGKVDDLSEMKGTVAVTGYCTRAVRYDTAEKRASTSGKDGDSRFVRQTERIEQLQSDIKKITQYVARSSGTARSPGSRTSRWRACATRSSR